MKKGLPFAFVLAALLVAAVPAFAAGPNFGSAILADGQTWGTKGNATLPAPNPHNRQSFDGLYKFTTQALPVAEAAPGNPAYNGGRWIEYSVTWNVTPVMVTSFADLEPLINSGAVTVHETGTYFQCPLLPDKSA